MPLSIPNTFTAGTKAKASEVNANFDAVEALLDGTLPLDELADGSSGQIIVCNASGVPTYRTPSGPVAISNTGVNSLSYASASGSGISLPAGGAEQTICQTGSLTGTYLVFAKVMVRSTGDVVGTGHLLEGLSTIDSAEWSVGSGVSNGEVMVPFQAVASPSAELLSLTVGDTIGGTAYHGSLIALRVA